MMLRFFHFVLVVVFLSYNFGCTSLHSLSYPQTRDSFHDNDSRIVVYAPDGFKYDFPRKQYSLVFGEDSALVKVAGYGDKIGKLGIADRGYFEITAGHDVGLKIEKYDSKTTFLVVAGVLIAATVAVIGISLISSIDSKGEIPPGEIGNN